MFRVWVTNPASKPLINEWSLQVEDQESREIHGYVLWEFANPTVTPTVTASGKDNSVNISFKNMHTIPPLIRDTHGMLVIYMPSGFQLQKGAASPYSCLDFLGLYNVSVRSRSLVDGVVCQGSATEHHVIYLRNLGEVPLDPSTYEFTFRVLNSEHPLETRHWQFRSYSENFASAEKLLDSSDVPGFPLDVNLRSFSVQPRPLGQQSSGKDAFMVFSFELTHEVHVNDMFVAEAPPEYSLEGLIAGSCRDFRSDLFPPPECSANTARFWFVNYTTDTLPEIRPFGTENSTVVNFEFLVTNPPVKPLDNKLVFVHCRTTNTNSTESSLCPNGWEAIASEQMELWSIVPSLREVAIVLLPPQVLAQGQPSLFKVQFKAASAGASKLRVKCDGMDFTSCTAEHLDLEATCVGVVGQATVTLASGQVIKNDDVVFELTMRRVLNPVTLGITTWSITTYDADDSAVDETVDHTGYGVTGYLVLKQVQHCKATTLLDPAVSQSQKDACTAKDPWFQFKGNFVTLQFEAIATNLDMRLGGGGGLGYRLLIFPPSGYRISTQGTPFQPGEGFPQVSDFSIISMASWNDTSDVAYFAEDILAIPLAEGLPQQKAFDLKVKVDNPPQDPTRNLWKVTLWDIGYDHPVYTNDGDWEGFVLTGTFEQPGGKTAVQWLVSNFPSEPNVVRLSVSLASPLSGQSLTLRVLAPQGFVFDGVCLPKNPDVVPALTIQNTVPWVTHCQVTTARTNEATLSLPQDLSTASEYSTNLLLTNAPVFEAQAFWELSTFRINDALNFVHYAKIPSFAILAMQASVYPEVRKFENSGFLHVSFRPLRDLGGFGQVLLYAPEAFTLFCRLRPFFDRGNLPVGVTCSGANTFAMITLSGSPDSRLEAGTNYHFALRVTNPNVAEFQSHHGTSATDESTSLRWRVRLQTRDRELVHETTQATGYVPTEKAITRFSVVPSSRQASQEVQIRVQFKLETQLLRWRTNFLELTAPGDFVFACYNELALHTFVTPANAVLPGHIQRFEDLVPFLEIPPSRGSEIYRNDGTTEDGRDIVDCSKPGVIGLAVDFTDEASSGRFAFDVVVQNPSDNPVPNMWKLRSISDGQLLEEGATDGYDVTNHSFIDPNSNLPPVASSASWTPMHRLVIFLLLLCSSIRC
jgi:hypothetical protein